MLSNTQLEVVIGGFMSLLLLLSFLLSSRLWPLKEDSKI